MVQMRAIVAASIACTLMGCSIRQDNTGMSRVGVFLWGFGDPPGVNWNLDAPRRSTGTINDNPERVSRRAPDSTVVPLPRGADVRGDDAVRR